MASRFLDFKVYQDAKELHQEIVAVTKGFSCGSYHLKGQIRRSSLSAILQTAEGLAKREDKDFNRYLKKSMGSVNEMAAVLDVAWDLNLVSEEKYQNLCDLEEEVVSQLGGLPKKLLVEG